MEQKEKLLDRVRGLIDTADSYENMGNTAAAQSYREKADQLMTLYAIEAFELEFAKDAKDRVYKPELREYDMGHVPIEIRSDLRNLFDDMARHCRVLIGSYGNPYKLVGYPMDLDYLDILFTSVRLHMSANVRPSPSRDLGYEASLALLKESGMKWASIYQQLLPLFPEKFDRALAKHPDNLNSYEWRYQEWQWEYERKPNYANWEESAVFDRYYVTIGGQIYLKEMIRPIGVRFTGEYTRFCKETGRERIYADPEVWLRSFVQGYVAEIRMRLSKMRHASESASTGKELVLANLEGDLKEFLYECFPNRRPAPPHPPDCDCDYHHYLRCTDPKCKNPYCKEMRKPVRFKAPKELAVSAAAQRRGREAGSQADLSGRGNRVGGGGAKELG